MATTESFSYCPALQELLDAGNLSGRSGKRFENLSALSTANNLIQIRNLMLRRNPSRTLEIGLSFGGSALAFAAAHRDLGHFPAGQHVALDPYQHTVWDDCGLLALERAGLAQYMDFRSASSATELPGLLRAAQQFNLIYVDGSHLFEDVFVDAYYSIRLLSEDGLVLFDDSANSHVAKVLRFLRKSAGSGLREIDLAPYRSDAGRSLRYRVAHAIGRTQLTAFQRVGPVERDWNAAFEGF
jgi:predicted O-methyltransferase YrrM